MSLTGIITLSCVLMALTYFLVIRTACRSCSPIRQVFLYPLLCSLVLTSGYMIWGYHAICTSRSSTAAIGLFFLPIYSVVIAVVSFLVSCALAIVLFVVTSYFVEKKEVARQRVLEEPIPKTDSDSLVQD